MVCALTEWPSTRSLSGDAETISAEATPGWGGALPWPADEMSISRAAETAGGEDPFDDFEDDDFDDEFDDDFEEDWEDDLTEDEEFPDTFGGEEEGDDSAEEEEESPFADDPDFDDD